MIRLPLTSIALVRADLKDYDKRQRQQDVLNASKVTEEASKVLWPRGKQKEDPVVRFRDRSQFGDVSQLAEADSHTPVIYTPQCYPDQDNGILQRSSPKRTHSPTYNKITAVDYDSQSTRLTLPPTAKPTMSLSDPEDDFRFEGFVDCPVTNEVDDPSIHTPTVLSRTEVCKLRGPQLLPRSPLFMEQNLSSSPERRPTSSLTPRVKSRVAYHNTPGIIFSQPARRPPRGAARTFRHQSNSFSFDSSERASAAYEQERTVSISTTEGTAESRQKQNLYEELQGKSLSGSEEGCQSPNSSEFSIDSSVNLPLLDSQPEQDPPGIHSSLLSLPPPFSAVSRSSSTGDVLPSKVVGSPQHPATSPYRHMSSSPLGKYKTTSPSVHSNSVLVYSPSLIETVHLRPFHPLNGSLSQQDLPTQTSGSPVSSTQDSNASDTARAWEAQTPSRYQVYNDSLPPYSQPQTPAHLPERRHQSLFHPSLTAPLVRAMSMISLPSRGNAGDLSHDRNRVATATLSRRIARRINSPTGLRRHGFEGLYGGRENGNEEQDWADGVIFNSPGMRLWREGDESNEIMGETPEPAHWRLEGRS